MCGFIRDFSLSIYKIYAHIDIYCYPILTMIIGSARLLYTCGGRRRRRVTCVCVLLARLLHCVCSAATDCVYYTRQQGVRVFRGARVKRRIVSLASIAGSFRFKDFRPMERTLVF